MKKALTIYIDDDDRLTNICATFVCWEGEKSSVTMLNEKVPEEATGIYLPFKSQTNKTEWIIDNSLPEIIKKEYDEWDRENAVTIGNNIKKALSRSGMQQKELAKKLKVTEVSISRYLAGKRIPTAPTICRIARLLGVSVDDLMEGAVE